MLIRILDDLVVTSYLYDQQKPKPSDSRSELAWKYVFGFFTFCVVTITLAAACLFLLVMIEVLVRESLGYARNNGSRMLSTYAFVVFLLPLYYPLRGGPRKLLARLKAADLHRAKRTFVITAGGGPLLLFGIIALWFITGVVNY